ncbi:MAG: transglycosylase domain-containing protein [Bacteroidota bacterium]
MGLKDKLDLRSKWLKKSVYVLWSIAFTGFILLPVYVYTVNINFAGLYGGMPSLKTLENPENDLSSELISADGISLGRYYLLNRLQIGYDELSEELVTTLLSSEDHRFYGHAGIDLIGLLRAAKGVLTFGYAGGGSTITMQLAENLFRGETESDAPLLRMPGLNKLIIKTKEWLISAQLESNFTKKEIIAMYLNTVPFGQGAFGIKSAAETYFGKSADSLNYQESAVLIGLLQGNTAFNPIINPERSLKKRNEVLNKLNRFGPISAEELDSLKALPIDVSNYEVKNQNTGLATYFRSVIRRDLMKWCKDHGYDLWEDGLKIYTTIDSRMQRYAEEAVAEHMSKLQDTFNEKWGDREPWRINGQVIPNYLEKSFRRTEHYRQLVKKYGKNSDSIGIIMKTPRPMRVFSWKGEIDTVFSPLDSINYYKRFLRAGMMSMDPETGHIKAWVGGINHKYFKYDHVRLGKRQPGSTFKPFIYGTAIEQNFPPCYEVPDVMVSIQLPNGKTYQPPNSDGKYGSGEVMTIRQAMARSVNTITAHLMQRVRPKNVVEYAQRVGIESDLDEVYSLALGVSDVSVYEMVGAYSTFVNQGIYTKPYFISRIEDKNGNVLENWVPETRQAISEQNAYKMLYMLRGGVEEERGTSSYLPYDLKIDNEIGGKTGTTNNASDGWYMGITKDLVTGVWVGGDERSIHFERWVDGQGGRTAQPIWVKYMTKVYNDEALSYEKGKFQRPVKGIDVALDCDKYKTNEADSLITQPVEEWDPNDHEDAS